MLNYTNHYALIDNHFIMRIIVIIALIISLSSCCTKQGCLTATDINWITFTGFQVSELDSIIIYSYTPNTNFTALVDSLTTQSDENSGSLSHQIYMSNIIVNHDHLIYLPSTNDTFLLDNIIIETKGCNTCFPYTPEDDLYDEIQSYSINGNIVEESFIEIVK